MPSYKNKQDLVVLKYGSFQMPLIPVPPSVAVEAIEEDPTSVTTKITTDIQPNIEDLYKANKTP